MSCSYASFDRKLGQHLRSGMGGKKKQLMAFGLDLLGLAPSSVIKFRYTCVV